MANKKLISAVIGVAGACAVGFGGWKVWQHFMGGGPTRSEKVYVQKVGYINTVSSSGLFTTDFAGVIVAQKSVDVKYDQSQTVDELLVSEGDSVKKGDKLLTYNIETIELNIENKKLEIERLENSIQTNNAEIAKLEQEKRTATGDAQITYTANILNLQSQNAQSEYDIKTKNLDLQKLEKSLKNAYVAAPISGTVKSLHEPGSGSGSGGDMYGMYGGGESADVLLTITADGDFRVKGTFNEQNADRIYQGAPVLLKSRVDDTTWHGTISEIDTSPQQNNNDGSYYYGGMSDEQTTSSKYAFYVEPESLDGFMLGQHILIEPEENAGEIENKEGIWLYTGFVLWDGDDCYVWAKNSKGAIEKRRVKVGKTDEAAGDCEILSGLSNDDYIAFPADYIAEGMGTTTNSSDKDIPDNISDNDFGGMEGDYGMNGGAFVDDNIVYDNNGNMLFTDEDGNTYTFDPEGNMIDGDELTDDEETDDEPDEAPKDDDGENGGDEMPEEEPES
ncbi:MAG: efflux RND transporter periplasmic adaptor subunit [Oscillospiraceae bacterium]|nr:efflux RND transporter periplasmic adaptor subunit [Oscillospiraceae bacterium]